MAILSEFLTTIANAIRSRKGKTGKIAAANFDEEILSIESPLENIEITANGEVNVNDYKKATVNVPGYETMVSLMNKDMTSFEIPEDVENINDYMFYKCSNLKIITGKNINEIKQYAFRECSQLQNISFESIKVLGDYAFYFCSNLKTIDLTGVEQIGNQTFNYCENLIELHIPESIVSINNSAFRGIGGSNTGSKKLVKIYLPKKTLAFGYLNCEGTTIDLYISCTLNEWLDETSTLYLSGSLNNYDSSGVKLLNENNEYTAFENITFPPNLTKIRNGAFSCFMKLKTVNIPEGITEIGDQAFKKCKNLTEISVPSTVQTIGGNSFCTECKTTYIINSTVPPTIQSNTFWNASQIDKIYVPVGTRNTYISDTNWSRWASLIVEPNTINFSVPTELLNNENYTYSIDQGKTWNQFTTSTFSHDNLTTVRFKNTNAAMTLLIGTSAGASDIGTIANAELNYATTGNQTIYITIQ